ncbi:immunity protein YezG family protein [Aliivibrio wodanis]|uniref:immunity protein YezG family protein n=1 Tax=Aliivibrio wodanis TaxID=80852 RepID=UPI00406C8243
MFENEINIYHHIGQSMFNVLPDKWDRAYFIFKMLEVDNAALSEQFYMKGNDFFGFDVDEDEYSETFEAFDCLFKMMQTNDLDTPWNKARFELKPDGSFDMKFKYDEDFAWLVAVDHYSDAYERLSANDMNLIKSWDGVPEVYDRYWLK